MYKLVYIQEFCLFLQGELISSGEIRVFKLGAEANELAVVFTADYKALVLQVMTKAGIPKSLIGNIINTLWPKSFQFSQFFTFCRRSIFSCGYTVSQFTSQLGYKLYQIIRLRFSSSYNYTNHCLDALVDSNTVLILVS